MRVDIGCLPNLEFDVNCSAPRCNAWAETEVHVISEGVFEIMLPAGWEIEVHRDEYKPSSKVVLEACCPDHREAT